MTDPTTDRQTEQRPDPSAETAANANEEKVTILWDDDVPMPVRGVGRTYM